MWRCMSTTGGDGQEAEGSGPSGQLSPEPEGKRAMFRYLQEELPGFRATRAGEGVSGSPKVPALSPSIQTNTQILRTKSSTKLSCLI